MRSGIIWAALAVAWLLASCQSSSQQQGSGSNTNWLRRCETNVDCPTQSECWCRTCMVRCKPGAACGAQTCRATTGLGCGEASESATLCIAQCETAADCRDAGDGLECLQGVCVAANPAPATGGSGFGASQAGSSSAGAAGGAGVSGAAAGEAGAGSPSAGAGGTAGSGTESGDAGAAGTGPTLAPLDPSALHAVALASDLACTATNGKVYCWGNNAYGQLGYAPALVGTRLRPEIAGLQEVESVAVSDEHACALTASGDVYCWGLNNYGQVGDSSAADGTCGNGTTNCQPKATRVAAVRGAVEIAVVRGLSCARLSTGGVQCWGALSEAVSQWAASVSDATSIAMATAGVCATHIDGALTCSFALPPGAGELPPARRVVLSYGAADVNTSGFGCVLDMADRMHCFGDDSAGQLGDGDGAPGSVPSGGFARLALGADHGCALNAAGVVACWGLNNAGTLGGSPASSPVCGSVRCEHSPRAVEGVPEFVAIGAGADRTCALSRNGSLWCWGIPYLRSAPVREPGPWEAVGETCEDFLGSATAMRAMGRLHFDWSCDVAADCVEVPLDLSCDHTCATELVSRAGLAEATALLEDIETRWCEPANDATCAAPVVSCPATRGPLFCVDNQCEWDHAERSGCTDPCECAFAAFRSELSHNECAGFDLDVAYPLQCSTCQRSALYIGITNRGTARFTGNAILASSAPVSPRFLVRGACRSTSPQARSASPSSWTTSPLPATKNSRSALQRPATAILTTTQGSR